MSPLELEIMIHYYSLARDYRNGDFSAPAVQEALIKFCSFGLLKETEDLDKIALKYVITQKGEAFVKALCQVPFPENITKYEIPDFKFEL